MTTSDEKEPCTGFRTQILVYAVLNLFIRGIELMVPVISTCFMVAPLISGNSYMFHNFLHEEANRVLWKGPYPANFSLASALFSYDVAGNVNDALPSHVHTNKRETENIELLLIQGAQLKLNLHIWSANMLMKCLIFVSGWLLLFSVKKTSYSGFLAWFSFIFPILIQNVLQLMLDFLLGDFIHRRLHVQILQCVDITYQIIGVVIIAVQLRYLYRKMIDGSLSSNRHSQPDGEISIQEMINQRY